MNRLEKLAQVNKAARHVLRTRQIKKAYSQDWVDMVKYLAETGQLAPESIEELKKLYDQGMLSKILQGAANEAGSWGIGTALATGLVNAARGGIRSTVGSAIGAPNTDSIGKSILNSALVGGGLGLGVGGLIGGISSGLNYKKEKEQLKSILDAVNANASQTSAEATPEAELATAAMV